MTIKNSVFVLFSFLFSLQVLAVDESPFSHCQLNTRGLLADNMEFIDTPANIKLSSETGIQILAIKRPLSYPTAKYKLSLEPIHFPGDKTALANDVARFLNAFPQDFLVKNQNICFLLVEDTQDAEAMATKNVVFLPIDATFEAMAHEFMHAVDDIHDRALNYENWDLASGSCRYNRNVNIDRPFAAGSADQQCFITPYSKTDLWEDRAEIFSALYRNRLHQEMPEAVLRKSEELKRFLRNISPSMTEGFWSTRRDFSW